MTESTIKALPLAQRIYLHGELLNHGILPSCLTCVHAAKHDPEGGRDNDIICELNSQFPPLSIVAVGCECWQQDIPF